MNIDIMAQIQLLKRNRERYVQSLDNLKTKAERFPDDPLVKEYVARESASLQSHIKAIDSQLSGAKALI